MYRMGMEAFTMKKAVGRKLKLDEIYVSLPRINVAKNTEKEMNYYIFYLLKIH